MKMSQLETAKELRDLLRTQIRGVGEVSVSGNEVLFDTTHRASHEVLIALLRIGCRGSFIRPNGARANVVMRGYVPTGRLEAR